MILPPTTPAPPTGSTVLAFSLNARMHIPGIHSAPISFVCLPLDSHSIGMFCWLVRAPQPALLSSHFWHAYRPRPCAAARDLLAHSIHTHCGTPFFGLWLQPIHLSTVVLESAGPRSRGPLSCRRPHVGRPGSVLCCPNGACCPHMGPHPCAAFSAHKRRSLCPAATAALGAAEETKAGGARAPPTRRHAGRLTACFWCIGAIGWPARFACAAFPAQARETRAHQRGGPGFPHSSESTYVLHVFAAAWDARGLVYANWPSSPGPPSAAPRSAFVPKRRCRLRRRWRASERAYQNYLPRTVGGAGGSNRRSRQQPPIILLACCLSSTVLDPLACRPRAAASPCCWAAPQTAQQAGKPGRLRLWCLRASQRLAWPIIA